MPIECNLLEGTNVPIDSCPRCQAPFEPFLRGMVQRSPWTWRTLWLPIGKPRSYCALICRACKKIVGYE